MATHKFGIMQQTPDNERYDSYEPQSYDCISIDDDFIEPLMPMFDNIPCYCHTRLLPTHNLVYCGITLIPPKSAKLFTDIFRKNNIGQYDTIILLFEEASKREKYIIHYGL